MTLLIPQTGMIDNVFVSKYIQALSKRYLEISSILPSSVLYKSAARIYKSSGIVFLLNTDPNWCINMATVESLKCNPHMMRIKNSRSGSHSFRQTDTKIIASEKDHPYFKIMSARGFEKGASFLLGNDRYCDGLGFLGDTFFREKQFQDFYEREVKYIMSEISKLFDIMETEYRLSRMRVFDFENNLILKYGLGLNRKIYLRHKEAILRE